jgi:uncharacterized membrane protein YeaQ/YmgE (transglycosylase-associated protein family)
LIEPIRPVQRWPLSGGHRDDRFAADRAGLQIVARLGEKAMGIVWTLIIGLLAGIVAKFLMPGPDPGGIIITILLGIAGAFLATFLGQTIGWYEAGEGAGFIGAVVGAVIILIIYRMMRKRSAA